MATATPKTTAKRATKTAAKKTQAAAVPAVNEAEDFSANVRAQFENMMSQFTGNTDEMREKAEEMTEEMRTRFEKQQQLAANMNAEIVEAAKTEVSDAVQFVSELGQAKTFTDALTIQQDYWSNLFETRMARTQVMTEKTTEAAKEALTPATSDFGAMFDMSAFEKMFRFPAKA